MACSLGRIQISLALLDEVKASDVATDAFIPRRRFASPCQAKNKTFLLSGWSYLHQLLSMQRPFLSAAVAFVTQNTPFASMPE